MTNSKAKHMRVLHFVMSYPFAIAIPVQRGNSLLKRQTCICQIVYTGSLNPCFRNFQKSYFFIEGVHIIITTIEGMVGRQFGTSTLAPLLLHPAREEYCA